jgi:hypothetical protein
MPEENEGRAIVERLAVTGDLPSGFQQLSDADSLLGGAGSSRGQHECREARKNHAPQRNSIATRPGHAFHNADDAL